MKIFLKIPFLFLILIIFNGTIISNPLALDPEAVPFFSMPLPSGAIWHATRGDFIVIGGIILLFLEILKSTRFSRATIVEHILSLVVFVALVIEFIIWPAASNSTCVVLILISLLDVIGGLTVSFSTARRDFSMGGIH